MRYVLTCCLFCALAACDTARLTGEAPEVSGEAHSGGVTTEILVRPRARPEGFAAIETASVDAGVDPASEASQVASGRLGTTVASLGNPAEGGLWLKTPLVQAEAAGTVTYPATGKSVAVTLLPLEGPATAGSQLSLSAMQGLGAPLTDLPTIEVYQGA